MQDTDLRKGFGESEMCEDRSFPGSLGPVVLCVRPHDFRHYTSVSNINRY